MSGLFDDLYDDVLTALEGWRPGSHRTEPDYSDELATYLRRILRGRASPFSIGPSPIIAVERESGRGLCDVVVNRQIGIELKKDFKGKSALDRLRGQIDDYVNTYRHTIIVMVGHTDQNTLDTLRLKIARINQATFGIGLVPSPTVRVILK